MTTTGDSPLPAGSWTHSFEEDAGGIEVYRPTLTYAFPPARRPRQRLNFGAGDVTESEPGPDDRPRARGVLPATGPGRFGSIESGQAGFEIVEATPEVLRVRRA